MSVLCRDYVGIVSGTTSVLCRYCVGILSDTMSDCPAILLAPLCPQPGASQDEHIPSEKYDGMADLNPFKQGFVEPVESQ